MNRLVINVQTGEQKTVPLTAEEVADAQARTAAEAEARKPRVVTMRQARLALLQAGLLGTVNAALDATAGTAGEAARIEWEYAATVERDSPLVAGFVATLGFTEAQIDGLFAAAAEL